MKGKEFNYPKGFRDCAAYNYLAKPSQGIDLIKKSNRHATIDLISREYLEEAYCSNPDRRIKNNISKVIEQNSGVNN